MTTSKTTFDPVFRPVWGNVTEIRSGQGSGGGGIPPLGSEIIQRPGGGSEWILEPGTILDNAPGIGDRRQPQPGRCLVFNGSTQYITVNDSGVNYTNGLSVVVWFEANVNRTETIIRNRPLGALGTSPGFSVEMITGSPPTFGNTFVEDTAGNYVEFTAVENTYRDGSWHCLSVTFDNLTGNVSLFIDGVLKDSQTNVAMIGGDVSPISPSLNIGSEPGGTRVFLGQIFAPQVYDRALSPTEITNLYRQGREPWHNTGGPTDAVGQWLLDDSSTTVARNSGSLLSSADGTIVGGVGGMLVESAPYSAQNLIGYTEGTGDYIPAQAANPSLDTDGNPIQYAGRCPRDAALVDSMCATWNGTTEFLAVPHLVGTETVTSSGGTSTPSVSAGRVDFTAGTCWDLLLSDGTRFPMSEGSGVTCFSVNQLGNDGTVTDQSGSFWNNTQDAFHWDVTKGFTDNAGVHVPALANGSADAEGNQIEFPSQSVLNSDATNLDFTNGEHDAPWVDSVYEGWAEFDGVSGFVDLGPVPLIQSKTSWTIQANVKIATITGSPQTIYAQWTNAASNNRLLFRINGTGNVSAFLDSGAGYPSVNLDGTTALTTGAEYVVSLKKEGALLAVYLDGTIEDSHTDVDDGRPVDNQGCLVGARSLTTPYNANLTNFFDGTIRNAGLILDGSTVAIWPLSTGSAYDKIGNNNGTPTDGVTFPTVPMETAYAKGDTRTPPNYVTHTPPVDKDFETKVSK